MSVFYTLKKCIKCIFDTYFLSVKSTLKSFHGFLTLLGKIFHFLKMTSYGRIFELWSIYNEPHVHAHDVYSMYIHVHSQVKDKNIFHIVFFYSYKLHDVVAIHTLAFGKLQRLFLYVCKICTYTLKAVKPKSKFEIQIFKNVKK